MTPKLKTKFKIVQGNEMKYALVNSERKEAQPNLIGKCICCASLVIAKCGKVNVWHWAHKNTLVCDRWWESETQWHREWKMQFPIECQEIMHYADNGEKNHIADVKTASGYVVEFQHSAIKPEEKHTRESFYKKMIWVVDGLRRLGGTKRLSDQENFIKILKQSELVNKNTGVLRLPYFSERECPLLRDWNDCKSPVFFDFGQDILWGLLPKACDSRIYIFRIDRMQLIMCLRSESQIIFEELLKPLTDSVTSLIKNEQFIKEFQGMQQTSQPNHISYRRHQINKRL